MAEVEYTGFDPEKAYEGVGYFDDGDGTCIESCLVPWCYPKGPMAGTIFLFMLVVVRPDDSELPDYVQHYKLADIGQWVPSKDGEAAVSGDMSESYEKVEDHELDQMKGGHYVRAPGGTQLRLQAGSKGLEFMESLLKTDFPKDRLSNDFGFLTGTHGHWNHIPEKQRKNLPDHDRKIFVLTHFNEFRKVDSTVHPQSATKELDDGFNKKFDLFVVGHLSEHGASLASSLTRGVMTTFRTKEEKTEALSRLSSKEFLSGSDNWKFDTGTNTLNSV